jgi:peptidoglycan/xylan/chitin deacetylase (PgdA/CDA1 family)
MAEACQHGECRGMHSGEWLFLAVWVPLTVVVATGDWLCRWLGFTVGMLLALPVGFLALNLLPVALGGRNPGSQWRMWLLLCTLWALFHADSGGVVAFFAWGWIVLFMLNAAACLLSGCRALLGGQGNSAVFQRLVILIGLHLLALGAGWRWGWPWAIAGCAFIAALYCRAVLLPRCQWLGPVRCRTGDRSILITIDDWPDPYDTPRLLDLLDQYQVKAVFFMIGEKVAAHPELAREVLRRGHEIGNHTMTHPQAGFWCAGPSRTRREIEECQRVIERITGARPRWFRAPVGHRNLFTHPIAGELGLEVMAWSRRGFDAVEKDAGKVLDRILTKLGPGDIVLVHEATPIAVEVLEGVLGSHALSASRSPRP